MKSRKKAKPERQMTGREWVRTPEYAREARKHYSAVIPKLLESENGNGEIILPRSFLHPTQIKPKRFIEYHEGHLYAGGKLIDFPDPDAIYVFLVKALHSDGSEGFLSYDAISKFIDKETGSRITDKTKKKKRILNALTNLYRKRKRQKNKFPRKTPDGVNVIRKDPGKGLILMNPTL